MTDTSWTVHTDTSGSIDVPGAVGGSYPSFGVGDSISITFLADEITDAEFETLHEFVRYANDGTSETGIDIRGKPYYHESTHPQSDFTSQLVRLEPGGSLEEIDSWWCVIEGATLTTNTVGVNRQIELDCFVLAEYDDYSDRKYVESEFEAGL
ncbi:hypothetical protein G6M89_09290 [Natronolimnobius sp. AArcel1]|uniref:hypothetical protein n=1 Tax=Natronolimnobius sp. AArcel1 TaxID=1679093 RepID=UPI0013EB08A1|nr:hypothetical protein [Natronolimnobius sp. AArcel1]NGM69198.1 hypothetical protein [Natronolimnobius sp. AArcel1]